MIGPVAALLLGALVFAFVVSVVMPVASGVFFYLTNSGSILFAAGLDVIDRHLAGSADVLEKNDREKLNDLLRRGQKAGEGEKQIEALADVVARFLLRGKKKSRKAVLKKKRCLMERREACLVSATHRMRQQTSTLPPIESIYRISRVVVLTQARIAVRAVAVEGWLLTRPVVADVARKVGVGAALGPVIVLIVGFVASGSSGRAHFSSADVIDYLTWGASGGILIGTGASVASSFEFLGTGRANFQQSVNRWQKLIFRISILACLAAGGAVISGYYLVFQRWQIGAAHRLLEPMGSWFEKPIPDAAFVVFMWLVVALFTYPLLQYYLAQTASLKKDRAATRSRYLWRTTTTVCAALTALILLACGVLATLVIGFAQSNRPLEWIVLGLAILLSTVLAVGLILTALFSWIEWRAEGKIWVGQGLQRTWVTPPWMVGSIYVVVMIPVLLIFVAAMNTMVDVDNPSLPVMAGLSIFPGGTMVLGWLHVKKNRRRIADEKIRLHVEAGRAANTRSEEPLR